MVSVPVPKFPTASEPEFVQLEPAPVTVTVPVLPDAAPMLPLVLLTAPPSATVSVPVPKYPTVSSAELVQVEPTPVTVAVPSLPG